MRSSHSQIIRLTQICLNHLEAFYEYQSKFTKNKSILPDLNISSSSANSIWFLSHKIERFCGEKGKKLMANLFCFWKLIIENKDIICTNFGPTEFGFMQEFGYQVAVLWEVSGDNDGRTEEEVGLIVPNSSSNSPILNSYFQITLLGLTFGS